MCLNCGVPAGAHDTDGCGRWMRDSTWRPAADFAMMLARFDEPAPRLDGLVDAAPTAVLHLTHSQLVAAAAAVDAAYDDGGYHCTHGQHPDLPAVEAIFCRLFAEAVWQVDDLLPGARNGVVRMIAAEVALYVLHDTTGYEPQVIYSSIARMPLAPQQAGPEQHDTEAAWLADGCIADVWTGDTYRPCRQPTDDGGGFCPDHRRQLADL